MQPTYSIIIPHKNIPDLLQRCLDSIPKRDDVQIIIVDDNSDSEKVDFEHFPGINHSNTEVYFDKTGRGAGRARNVGIEHAKGEWLIFSDADDVFTKGFIEILEKLNEKEDSDIVYFDIESRDSETLEPNEEHVYFSNIIKQPNDFELRYGLLTPWMKAVKKTLIVNNSIKFEEVPCSNDTWFSAMCSYFAKSVSIIPVVGYCWMSRTGSLWRKKDMNWCRVRFEVSLRIAKFMKNNNESKAYERFNNDSLNFLSSIEQFSIWQHWYAWMKYALSLKDKKNLFVRLPRLFCHNIIIMFKKATVGT